MERLRKITRIIWKTLKYSVLVLLLLIVGLLIAINTSTFQTWAAQKATNYLSDELNTRVSIRKLKIEFVKSVVLEGVYMEDLHHDTLLFGQNLTVNLSGLSIEKHQLRLDEIALSNVKVKLLKYKGEPDFNYQFLADYFQSADTTRSDTGRGWNIKYGALKLNGVDFTYRLLRDTDRVVQNMNYNNIQVKDIHGTISRVSFIKDTIFATITDLRAREQCGFVLNKLSTIAKVAPNMMRCDSLTLVTPNSYISGRLKFEYTTWDDYNDFVNKVYIKARLKPGTQLNFKDIAYFAEELNGFHETLDLSGRLRGYVNDLSGIGLDFRYADNTRFEGDLSITGLPDFEHSYIHFDSKAMSTTRADLERFPLPPFSNPTHLQLPKELGNLGLISYKGKFDGFMNDFVTYGTFKTAVGNISTDLAIHNDTIRNIVGYSGKLKSSSFDLSKLFPSVKELGPLSLDMKVKGKGFTVKDLNTEFDGNVSSITYNKYTYQQLHVDGTFRNKIFDGNLVSKDENADFEFNGTVNFTNAVPKMDFIATVNNFDLAKTNFSTKQLDGRVSSQILINLNGDNIDNLSGLVNFDNTIYKTPKKEYKISTFNLEMDQQSEVKRIELNSSIFNASVTGHYNLSTVPGAFKQYLNVYFPTFMKLPAKTMYKDQMELLVKIKNFTQIKELFLPDLMISNNTVLSGHFDASTNFLDMDLASDQIVYSDIKFNKNHLVVTSKLNGINMNTSISSLNLSDSLAFKDFVFDLNAADGTTDYSITWDNHVKPNYAGLISGTSTFNEREVNVNVEQTKIVLTDSIWKLGPTATLRIDSSGAIAVHNLELRHQDQRVALEGLMSSKETDAFRVTIDSLRLSQLNPLIKESKLSLNGSLNGVTTINALLGKMLINSNLRFETLKVNNRLIGSGQINSEYNAGAEFVSINGYSAFGADMVTGAPLKNFDFKGIYYPKKTENSLDVTFICQPFDLVFIQPFIKDLATIKGGLVTGNGKVTGTPDKPQVNASLQVSKCVMLIDYLNVQYSINGRVEIFPDQLNFINLELRDRAGNLGTISGNIFHDNFKNMRVDFDVNTTKMMVLNTTAANNPSYYGVAYATGNAGIFGFTDDIKMELNMKTNAGTHFFIPLGGPADIGDNDFIRFVVKDTTKKQKVESTSNFALDFNLVATPDAEVKLLFDEQTGDAIRANGNGNLNMKIDSKGKFDMFGDYVLTSGEYLFTLENVLTKKFNIAKGSSIKWSGNVYKADIDIAAIYEQRASVKPLFPYDSTGNYSKRYPVDCMLYMKNNLMNPDISFGIELPTIDETTRGRINSILSDEQELNRQVFSLLLLRTFVTPLAMSGGGISAGNAAAATGSEMASQRLTEFVSRMTREVDVQLSYQPGTSAAADELEVGVSKQLWNDRVTIDGNVGVAGNTPNSNKTTTNSGASNIIGDVTIEYKLTEDGRYRVKGFNRSNDNTQIATSGGPFTQGVGVFYREEYETLGELYRRYLGHLKRMKNKKKE